MGSFAGTAKAFQKSLGNEPLLVSAALLTVYIVLGVLYESYVHPITILSTLPSAAVGAVLALIATDTEFSLMALLGLILLIGIVKKNAITGLGGNPARILELVDYEAVSSGSNTAAGELTGNPHPVALRIAAGGAAARISPISAVSAGWERIKSSVRRRRARSFCVGTVRLRALGMEGPTIHAPTIGSFSFSNRILARSMACATPANLMHKGG